MTQIKILNLSALFIATFMISVLTSAITKNFGIGFAPLVMFWVFVGFQIQSMEE